MDPETLDHRTRLFVFERTAQTARVPGVSDISAALGEPREVIEASLRRLASGRAIVLAPGTTNIWLADPFAAAPTDFRVDALGRTYFGICIWDALGIPAALHADAVVHARCGDCGERMTLRVRGGLLEETDGIVHYGVSAARWWDNIAFT